LAGHRIIAAEHSGQAGLRHGRAIRWPADPIDTDPRHRDRRLTFRSVLTTLRAHPHDTARWVGKPTCAGRITLLPADCLAGSVVVMNIRRWIAIGAVSSDGRTTVVLSLDSNVDDPVLAAEYRLVDHVMCRH
jgi:hypothetical protein